MNQNIEHTNPVQKAVMGLGEKNCSLLTLN